MTPTKRITQLLDEYPPGARAYRAWEPKSNGKLRPIAKPNKLLAIWLRAMNKALNAAFDEWPLYMHGGIKGRSYVSYARPHVGKACVITVDVRDCFGSLHTGKVAAVLEYYLKLDKDISLKLARRLCFRDKVGQGFATSNFICNLYLLQSLKTLYLSFSEQGMELSNYVDDLALSGNITDPAAAIDQIAHELSSVGLAINREKGKIRVMPATRRQILCGLQVNRRLTLTRLKKLELLTAVADGTMSRASASGWVANLKNVDPVFQHKFQQYAIKKRLLVPR